MIPKENIIEFLSRHDLFKSCAPSAIEQLSMSASILSAEKDNILFIQGESANYCYLVIDGLAKCFIEGENGREVVVTMAKESELFGQASLLDNAHYAYSAQMVESGQVLSIPREAMKRLVQDDSDLTYRLLSMALLNEFKHNVELGKEYILPAAQRVGCYLLGMKEDLLFLPFEKRVIAAELHMTPETFSRALHELTSRGVDVKRNRFKIIDREQLKAFACEHCAKIALPGQGGVC